MILSIALSLSMARRSSPTAKPSGGGSQLNDRACRLILCLLAGALWFPTYAIAQPVPGVREVQVAFSPRGDGLALILGELRKAKSSVDVAMFYISHDDLVDALCHLASRRKVIVRVITDSSMLTATRKRSLERLESYGVSVHVVTMPNQGKMHLKCLVIDGGTVITGAANWTKQAFDSNFEDTLIFRSAALANAYLAVMEKMVANAEPLGSAPYGEQISLPRVDFPRAPAYEQARRNRDRKHAPRSRTVTDVRSAEVHFTPGREGLERLIKSLEGARQRIAVGMYILNDPELVKVLSGIARANQVKILLLVDHLMLGPSYLAQLRELSEAGVEIRHFGSDRENMHMKTAVIDDRHVWSGSANWTQGAMSLNIEDMLLIESEQMAAYYRAFLDDIAPAFRELSPVAAATMAEGVQNTAQYDKSGYLVGLPPTGVRANWSEIFDRTPFDGFEVGAWVRYLPDEEYFPVLLDLIRTAHQSVLVSMYVMSETATDAKVQEQLVRELERAASRGVYVYMVLHLPESPRDRLYTAHSNWADRLRSKGIDARLNLPTIPLHDKMIVADLCKVIIGSHNWSEGALSGERVYESSALLVLPEPDYRFADYVLGRKTIQDMRNREAWEWEMEMIRRIASLSGGERDDLVRELEGRVSP